MEIYSTDEQLIIKIENTLPTKYYSRITTICDRDTEGKLLGMEVFLYEEPGINIDKIRRRFSGMREVEVNNDNLMYIHLRQIPQLNHGPGFGRNAKVGITIDDLFSILIFDWNSLGAGTPSVDRFTALKGLDYILGYPE